jgi:4-aminobutyrate aminotransferase-like enzyme
LDYTPPRHGFTSQSVGVAPEAVDLTDKLLSLAGPIYTAVHFSVSGALGLEAALLAATIATERQKFISLRHAYHGCTLGTQALAGRDFLRDPTVERAALSHLAEPAYCHRCAWQLKPETCQRECALALAKQIETGDFAAVVAEPMMTSTVIIPPRDFWQPIAKACRNSGTLLIFDEVVSGLGRTGRWWAQDHFGVQADILVTSKGLNAGAVPLSATLFQQHVREAVKQAGPFPFGQTDEAHPFACQMALQVIATLEERSIPGHVTAVGTLIEQHLQRIAERFEFITDVRGVGLLWGLELCDQQVPDSALTLIRTWAIDEGLLLPPGGRVLLLTPPLVITPDDLQEGVQRLECVLQKLATHVS